MNLAELLLFVALFLGIFLRLLDIFYIIEVERWIRFKSVFYTFRS